MTTDRSKRFNDITSLHSQYHHRLTDRWPIDNIATQLTNQVNNQSILASTDEIQLKLTLKMTTAQIVETSVTVNNNSPIQD